MSAFVRQIQFERLMWFVALFVGLLFVSLVVATGNFLVILMFGGVGWLLLLPYHTQIAIRLALATIASSLILPFLPGRPPFYEVAAILGWSGIIITLFLRRQSPGASEAFHRNLWVFLGLAGYLVVLLVLISQRGTGFMLFGAGQTGGKRYLTQLVCTIIPALFVVTLPNERLLVRFFIIQCLLSLTYVVGEFALNHLNSAVIAVLYFVDLPWDGLNFLQQRNGGGISRYQSLGYFAIAMLSLLFTLVPFKHLATRRIVWMGPLLLGLFGIGMLSGHRSFVYYTAILMLCLGFLDRFFSLARIAFLGAMLAVTLTVSYSFAESLPESIQRALYILPAFPASLQVKVDAENTTIGRQEVFTRSMQILPQYLWLGRGFASLSGGAADENLSVLDAHEQSGIFYNGPVTILINSGLPGAICLFLFFLAGTFLALRLFKHLRTHGINDAFERLCAVQVAVWFANLAVFLLVAGTPEDAVRMFGLLTGIMMTCEYHLRLRISESSVGLSRS
jgi:hypothetical protein